MLFRPWEPTLLVRASRVQCHFSATGWRGPYETALNAGDSTPPASRATRWRAFVTVPAWRTTLTARLGLWSKPCAILCGFERRLSRSNALVHAASRLASAPLAPCGAVIRDIRNARLQCRAENTTVQSLTQSRPHRGQEGPGSYPSSSRRGVREALSTAAEGASLLAALATWDWRLVRPSQVPSVNWPRLAPRPGAVQSLGA